MTNPLLIKAFTASGAIEARRIVSLESDKDVCQATDESAVNIGVTELACNSGDSVDVILSGLTDVKAGGTIARGDWVAADAEGRAVAVVAESGGAALGVALETAAEGEMVSVAIVPQRAAASGGGTETQEYVFSAKVSANHIIGVGGRGRIAAGGRTDNLIGVIQTDVTNMDVAKRTPVKVTVSGIVNAEAGEAITLGSYITAVQGKAYIANQSDNVIGVALSAAASGENVLLRIAPGRIVTDEPAAATEKTYTEVNLTASAAIAKGVLIAVTSAGQAKTATASDIIIGISAAAAESGEIVPVAVGGFCEAYNEHGNTVMAGNYIGIRDGYIGRVYAADSYYVGRALENNNSNWSYFKVLIQPGRLAANTAE